MYIYIYIYIYTYIIHTEANEHCQVDFQGLSFRGSPFFEQTQLRDRYMYVYVYTYIYVFIYIYICIFICIYRERERGQAWLSPQDSGLARQLGAAVGGTQTGSYQTGSYQKGRFIPPKPKLLCFLFFAGPTNKCIHHHQ